MRAVRNHSPICGIPFLPSLPKVCGARREAGLLCESPATVFGDGDTGSWWGYGSARWSSELILDQLQGAAVPYCPPPDPRDRAMGGQDR